MTDSKHSKLPWKLCGADAVYAGDIRGTKIAATRGGHAFHQDLSREEVEANAAFIVTACNAHPQIVAALKAAREHVQSQIDDASPGWKSAQRLVNQIDAALAVTYADHSYPAYSKAQMQQYASSCALASGEKLVKALKQVLQDDRDFRSCSWETLENIEAVLASLKDSE